MANLKNDSPVSRRIACSFLQFLNSVEPSSGVDSEALDVAKECLPEVFKIDQSSNDSLSNCDSLVDIFNSYEANARPIVGNGRDYDARTSSSGKNAEVSDESASLVGTKKGVSKRTCKSIAGFNKKKRGIPFLPDEILFHILVWLPADILYHCMRYVCRQWYDIICSPLFIEEHLSRSTTSFLLQFSHDKHLSYLVNIGESNAEITEVKFPPFHNIYASCDGLVIVQHSGTSFYVANLLTKQVINLPAFCEPWELWGDWSFKFSLVRGSSRNSYKLFVSYSPRGSNTIKCAVIDQVGKDRCWRHISCPNISKLPTLLVGRIIYWSVRRIEIGLLRYTFDEASRLLLAFDIESETFYEVPSPALDYNGNACFYVERGKSLSLFVRLVPKNVFDIWLVTDAWDRESAFEWRKHYTITLDPVAISEDLQCDRVYRYPEAWVSNGEVVVFRSRRGRFVAHNVKTGRTLKFGGEYGSEAGCGGFLSDFACSLVRLA